MRSYSVKAFVFVIALLVNIIDTNAQTVAILDQGYNSAESYRGVSRFVQQNCISYGDHFGTAKPTPNPLTHYVEWRASLCQNGLRFDHFRNNSAFHPRRNVIGYPASPNVLYSTSKKLTHGRDVSNALWDFDKTISHNIFQVFGFNANADVNKDGSPDTIIDLGDLSTTISDPRRYQTNSGRHIADALDLLSVSPNPGLAAVSISTVVGDGVVTPSICNSGLGRNAILRLRAKGVAVVAGLLNRDITASAKTWPNCLSGVINAGNTNTRRTPNGIGIGANGVDFYINSLTSVRGQAIPEQGNSLAAPKIAGAFALLHRNYPSSSVDQKYQALVLARNSYYSYKRVRKRRLRRSHIDDALNELNKIITGVYLTPPDDVISDEGEYGLAFGGASSDTVELDLNFSDLLATTRIANSNSQNTIVKTKSAAPLKEKDVIVEFWFAPGLSETKFLERISQ